MAFKALIFLGLLAVSLGFILPEGRFEALGEPVWAYGKHFRFAADRGLIRRARSPQRRIEGRFENTKKTGSSASIVYTQPINKNWEVYAGASRNFKFNDNGGNVGVRFKF